MFGNILCELARLALTAVAVAFPFDVVVWVLAMA
jgi:hypothetical protein